MAYSKDPHPTFTEFFNLSPKERKTLLATNWFRHKHKIPLIAVPPFETDYHKQFAKLLTEKK